MSSQKAKADREPTSVRLAKGCVQERVSSRLAELLELLPLDPQLDQQGAIADLLRTASHICIRYDEYKSYPTALWKLSRRYNPDEYPTGIR
eukprot:934041-Pyramimonas_sp.AAC.1